MVLLLTGASGFLGRHLLEVLSAAGHQVICAVRNTSSKNVQDPRLRHIAVDFTRDFDETMWLPRLQGIDGVINAVGIIRETPFQTFDAIHVKTPRALFSACVHAGVKLVIQISALGADAGAQSRYHRSKKEADDFLVSLNLPSVIVQPSLIYGDDGTSAKLFTTLASLPVIPLPGAGKQMIQPVHIEDVSAVIVALLDKKLSSGTRLPVVGPQPLSYRNFLSILRTSMGLKHPLFIPIPRTLMRIGTSASRFLPGSLLDNETLQMLERGNTAAAMPMCALLGRAPKPPEQFITQRNAAAIRTQAQLSWLLPMLRISIALVWIVTGIVSAWLFPVAESYALLARVGIGGAFAPVMLYGAALLDFIFGAATLLLKRRHYLWLAQLAVIFFYTAIISWKLPEFWIHPYGPLLKNLPMAAAIWLLLEMEKA
ncbi:MAG TPA: NAD(P)H-binding protein [Burkholderiaceae bacterium]|jgi:uncharacterized protein YbjT (DUF2867 family)